MSDKELTSRDHLDKSRQVSFRIPSVWFISVMDYFAAMSYSFDNVVLVPYHDDFIFYDLLYCTGERFDLHDEFSTQELHIKLISINLAAPFFIHVSMAFWMSVVMAAPYLLFEIWRLIRPALYPDERRGVQKTFCSGTVMFFTGVLLDYLMIYPLTLRFPSTYQLGAAIENQISLNSYIDSLMMLVFCMGLVFELPLITWLLSLLGLVHKMLLHSYRRHAMVAVVIVATIITPTGGPFALAIVVAPLYMLYKMSILMTKDKKTDGVEEVAEAEKE